MRRSFVGIILRITNNARLAFLVTFADGRKDVTNCYQKGNNWIEEYLARHEKCDG